jgi:hypothetical protein
LVEYIDLVLVEMDYITSVRKLADQLKDEETYLAFLKEFNRIGHEYFNSHRSGYSNMPEEDYDVYPIQVLTKEEFAKELVKHGRNDEVLNSDEASFDDAYRHAVIVDTSAVPAIVALPSDALGDATDDHIFTWAQVEAFAQAHPDGRYIIVHGDTIGPEFFLPIPTLKLPNNASRKRKRKTRKTRKNLRRLR